MKTPKKVLLLQKRRWRIRKKIKGTAERPRLAVRFTNQHIHAQCIDDVAGKTLVAISTLSKEVRDQGLKPNVAGATALGKILGKKAAEAGITQLVYDRAGRAYHGCVKAFADAVRETGISF